MSQARRTVLLLLLAGLPALGAAAPAMAQGTPGVVSVTVEGAGATLVPRGPFTTDAAPLDNGAPACPGTSAGGALERATGGAWTTDGTAVTSILGEVHGAALDGRRWVLAVNSVPTTTAPCDMPVNAGDTVLLFTAPSVPGADCRTNGRDGSCGTPDRTGPATLVGSITEQQRFTRATAPLVLRGVSADPSGIADVRIRLTRRIGTTRCATFDGIEDEFRRLTPCGAQNGRFFSIGAGPRWSWALPARLTRGRYTLDVQAVDGLGNVADGIARGRDRVVFTVG
jgi:hypothetical protein